MESIPARAVALYRLIVRPMATDPVRALLTVAAVTLGVAVIVAVDLASEASMGSFRSSLESMQGSASYEITQVGGIPETVYGDLVRLAEPLAFSPRIEGFALLPETGERVPLFGVDLVGDTTLGELGAMPQPGFSAPIDVSAVWVAPSLGVSAGDALELIAGDRRLVLEVQGVIEPPEAAAGGFVLMDVALAQRALGRMGRLDRIYVYTRGGEWSRTRGEERGRTRGGERNRTRGEEDRIRGQEDRTRGEEGRTRGQEDQARGREDQARGREDRTRGREDRTRGEQRDWPAVLARLLPPAASILPAGTGAEDSRRMLGAFRWNLRMMSYAAILVGAFLIYNTISAWIVRRRGQIGIVRAVGASRAMVRAAFLFEGAVFGVLGVAAGLAIGRLLALGAVETVGQTVSSLYVSSTPGEIALRPWTIVVAVVSGIGVSLLSAWWPAREAARVAPTEAMAGAAFDHRSHAAGPVAGRRSTIAAAVLAVLAAAFCLMPPVDRIPVGGYLALICLVGATAAISPWVSLLVLRLCDRWLAAPFGVVAAIAARGLAASLGRTSVIVSAMAVATALIIGMSVMVGSFRETVVSWIEHRLQADFYVSPVGGGGRGASATMSEELARKLEAVPGVMDVGRFRAYPIRYRGTPATLGLADVALYHRHSGIRFLEGPAPEAIWPRLAAGDSVIVSELFSYRHDVHPGDTIRLPLARMAHQGARQGARQGTKRDPWPVPPEPCPPPGAGGECGPGADGPDADGPGGGLPSADQRSGDLPNEDLPSEDPMEFRVAGVFYDYSGERGFVIGDRNALLRHLPDRRVSSLGVYLEPDAGFEESRQALVRAVSDREVVVTPSRTLRERSIEIFDRTFAITYALEAIAMLVAVLGMAEALLNLVIDRRTELAQLRMHGASMRQIRGLILVQAGLIGLAACGLGLVFGAAWSQVNLLVIHQQSHGWSVQPHWPGLDLVAVLGLIFAASVASGLYPARVGARLDPVEVLRGE